MRVKVKHDLYKNTFSGIYDIRGYFGACGLQGYFRACDDWERNFLTSILQELKTAKREKDEVQKELDEKNSAGGAAVSEWRPNRKASTQSLRVFVQ